MFYIIECYFRMINTVVPMFQATGFRPYLQVDFGRSQRITYLGVQGKANSPAIVTQFVMFYSQDGKSWDPYWKYSVRFRVS